MPPKSGKRITVGNHDLGTAYTLTVGQDGVIPAWARWRCFKSLATPPGYAGAGPLGEVGEQRPPETPGWRYTFEALPDGGVKATPHRVEQEVADSGKTLDQRKNAN